MNFEVFPLIVWIAFLIVNKYSKFQVNILSNKIYYKMSKKKKKSKLKRGIILKKLLFELSSLTEWITLWIVNTYSQFLVNIFNNNRDITKCQSFSTMTMTMKPRL